MCGIAGIVAFNEIGIPYLSRIDDILKTVQRRGPDGSGVFKYKNVALGHNRLAVIDTTEAAAQPFNDITGRYTIVFNGEFFNFLEHRIALEKKGFQFKSHSDTEVLLYL